MHQFNITIEEATVLACKYHDKAKARFIQLLGEVPSFGPQVDKELHEYIFSLAMWARGNVSWSFESRRYFGKDGFEVQRTRQAVLHPEAKRDTKVKLRFSQLPKL
jgi:Delta6-protoilludene synthase